MKKVLLVIAVIACFIAGAIYGMNSQTRDEKDSVQPGMVSSQLSMQDLMDQADAATAAARLVITPEPTVTPEPTIMTDPDDGSSFDWDFTKMSQTVAYAQIISMMQEKEPYVGKTVRIRGIYMPSYFPPTKQTYQYVAVMDATQCCQQGLEFIWSGEHVYPDDYPEKESTIEISGVFDIYEELDQKYLYIRTDEVTVI